MHGYLRTQEGKYSLKIQLYSKTFEEFSKTFMKGNYGTGYGSP